MSPHQHLHHFNPSPATWCLGALLLLCQFTHAGEMVTLAWNPSTSPQVAGYRVYYRTAMDTVAKKIDIGRKTKISIPGLEPETKYFFRVTTYNTQNTESAPSKEVSLMTSLSSPSASITDGLLKVAQSGRIGGTIVVYESSDLVNWYPTKTLLNITGVIKLEQLIDPRGGTQRFYRFQPLGTTFEGWKVANTSLDAKRRFGTLGISNRVAFATGADLTANPHASFPVTGSAEFTVDGTTDRYRTLAYTLRENTSGIIPIVEHSTDLSRWTASSTRLIEASSTLNGNGTRTIILREELPMAVDPMHQIFYRVRFNFENILNMTLADWMAVSGFSDASQKFENLAISNQIAFATGTDLASSPHANLPAIGLEEFTVGGRTRNYRTVKYTIREKTLGVVPVVEHSPDLSHWTKSTDRLIKVTSTLSGNGTRTITLRERLPMAFDPMQQIFYRVRFNFD